MFFTRYELLKLLNWPDATRSYRRLEESLNRWLGVTLYYERAWWSKEDQSWVNEGFHLLEHVQILDQERQRRSAKKNGEEAGKSSFSWNEVVFNSFKAGYIKQIDFEFYKGLKSAVSKRLYRFLDKRFYRANRLEFDLRVFCCEHIGLSKKYHTGELKRVLSGALAELETLGYIDLAASNARFVQKAKGEWSIVLTRANKATAHLAESSPIVQALIERGMSTGSARRIASRFNPKDIEQKMALVDWLSLRNDQRVKENPAGFLYRAITEHFPLPKDYQAALDAKARTAAPRVIPLTRRIERGTSALPQEDKRKGIDEYWSSLSADEQERVEVEIARAAPPFLRQQYADCKGKKDRELLFKTVRQAIIDDYVRSVISEPAGATA